MFGAMPEWLIQLLSMTCIGLVIQWVDDHLDRAFDLCRGERTLAVKMGRSCFVYGALLAVVAVCLDAPIATALFLGSYAVGMMSNWTERMPTRLPAGMETVLAAFLSVLLAGWHTTAWALCFAAWVDWLDDIIDYRKDGPGNTRNLARRIGIVETSVLVLLALLGCVWLNPEWTLLGFVAFAVVTVISELTTARLWTVDEEGGEDEDGPR
ncbi:MAG: hypothetical protein K6T78_09115 [Alicyclobacillus sp.]|nr:hypothetical protein [Alicyclobacillus sp.]